MIDLTFRQKITMIFHSICNPACIITLLMTLGCLIGLIINFNIILFFTTLAMFLFFNIMAYDMPRRILFAGEAQVVRVQKVIRESSHFTGYRQTTSYDIANWDAFSPEGEKIRLVYHTKNPPIQSGDSVIVIEGFRGKRYGFRDVR